MLALAFAPTARAQDVHPETPAGAEEEEQLQQQEQQDQTQQAQQTGQQQTEEEEEEEDTGPKRIWRKSTIFFDQGVSGWTLTHEGHTWNPTSSTLIRFQPLPAPTSAWCVRHRQDFS